MTTLGHVNIDTARLAETISFYCGLLDLEVGTAATRPDSPEYVWLFDGEGVPWIHLREVPEERPSASVPALNHIAFNYDHPLEAEVFLKRHGIEYRRSDTVVAGVFQFTLTDPNGICVELTFGHKNLRRR